MVPPRENESRAGQEASLAQTPPGFRPKWLLTASGLGLPSQKPLLSQDLGLPGRARGRQEPQDLAITLDGHSSTRPSDKHVLSPFVPAPC